MILWTLLKSGRLSIFVCGENDADGTGATARSGENGPDGPVRGVVRGRYLGEAPNEPADH